MNACEGEVIVAVTEDKAVPCLILECVMEFGCRDEMFAHIKDVHDVKLGEALESLFRGIDCLS